MGIDSRSVLCKPTLDNRASAPDQSSRATAKSGAGETQVAGIAHGACDEAADKMARNMAGTNRGYMHPGVQVDRFVKLRQMDDCAEDQQPRVDSE